MVAILVAVLLLASSATQSFAHFAPETHGSFLSGITHPLFGADHLLAMVTVGVWAAILGGRSLWLVPGAFLAAMVAGFGLAVAGVQIPLVEPAILASVVVIGLLTAIAASLPMAAGLALVAVCGIFHGYAHGGEIGSAEMFGYAAGFVVSTATLHALGAAIGIWLMTAFADARGRSYARLVGAAAAAGGIALAFGG